MNRWLTAGMAASLVVLLVTAALWSSAPPPAMAQTAPDVRLRETETPPARKTAGPPDASRLTLRLSSASLDEDGRGLANGADLTLLAQPTYVALPSAGSNLVRISPAITITARGGGGQEIGLSA